MVAYGLSFPGLFCAKLYELAVVAKTISQPFVSLKGILEKHIIRSRSSSSIVLNYLLQEVDCMIAETREVLRALLGLTLNSEVGSYALLMVSLPGERQIHHVI